MDGLLQQLAAQGLMGLIAALSFWIAFRKDNEARDCRERMIIMAEKSAERYHALATEIQRALELIGEDE